MAINNYNTGQSIGGGAYSGKPYDSKTNKPIVYYGGGGSSGSGSGSSRPSISTVSINGSEVIINGQGYSVVPGKITEFLSSKGISGSNYQSVVDKAKQLDQSSQKKIENKSLVLQSNIPKFDNNKSVTSLSRLIATPSGLTTEQFRGFNQAVYRAQNKVNNEGTVVILTNEDGKPQAIEYGGKSFNPSGFEKAYGTKLLVDPESKEFFFGTGSKTDKKPISTISSGFTPISDKEKKNVQNALLKGKIRTVATGELGIVDALTNTNIQKNLKKYGEMTYNELTALTTDKLDKYARLAKENATMVLNESDFKTGNKKIDLTAKSLGYVSYFGGSAGAYALNMISGFGRLALGLTFKQRETQKALILASPAMIKGSLIEIGKTFSGKGTIEDFFGSALTLATVGSTANSFSKLSKTYNTAKGLKDQNYQVQQAIKKSQALLKKEQLYSQRVIVQNSNKWKTFGKAYQEMNGMKARHSYSAITEGKVSAVLQKSVITNGKVRITNVMYAKSVNDKILTFMRKYVNRRTAGIVGDSFRFDKKIASYLSKVQARRAYTFVEVKGSRVVTAIDGRGNVKLLNNLAEVRSFIRNAKFGKFSFTGTRGVGGNIETVLRVGKSGYIGSEAFSNSARKMTAGATAVFEQPKSGVKSFKFSGKKTPFSKTFGSQALEQKQASLQVSNDISLSKGVRGSVVGSQLKSVSKAISNAISKNEIALRNGFTATIGKTGKIMFFSKSGQLVSPGQATSVSSRSIEVVQNRIKNIISDATKPSSRDASASSQKSGQSSKQESKQQQREMQRTSSGRSSLRTNFEIKNDAKLKLPSLDYKRKENIVKSILGNKIAPSYEIVIGSGKKVKKIGGRYSAKDAISKGAFVIDRSKERTVRIIPTNQKPNSKFRIDYLAQASRKFRNYRIRKGQRVRYSSTRLIEKRKFFNDFRNEIPKRRRNKQLNQNRR
jgi:hypothetical protein